MKIQLALAKKVVNFFMLLNNHYNFSSSSTKKIWEIFTGCLSKKGNLTLEALSKTRLSALDDAGRTLNDDWDEVIQALNNYFE